jgi:hypothetical protein
MMSHPITPPPALIEGWVSDFFGAPLTPGEGSIDLATRAAQWGADQELEACCEWLDGVGDLTLQLRADRRPKPPSLKELALDELHISFDRGYLKKEAAETILRALEALPE